MTLVGFSNRLYVKGTLIEIPSDNDEVTVDISFAFGTKIVGIKIFAQGCKKDDYAELSLVHPDPNIGELAKFGEQCYLPESTDTVEVEVFLNESSPEVGSEVPAGILYRLHLKAADSLGRKVPIWLILKR